jgi:hypothetical protein
MPSMRRVQEPLAQGKQRRSYSQGGSEMGGGRPNEMLEPPLHRADQESLLKPHAGFRRRF